MEHCISNEQFNEQLRERTMVMAISVYKLFRSREVFYINKPLVNQLIRCSSSVAANTRAATRARSDAEFYSKICIVVEECDESQFWLDFLSRIDILQMDETKDLKNEVNKLLGLFASIKRTMKGKINSRSPK